VVETAYPWPLDDIVGPATGRPRSYPPTPAGQTRFVRDPRARIAQTPQGLGRGMVYREPAWLPGVGWKPGAGNTWDNLTVFDPQGHALESIDCMQPAALPAGEDQSPRNLVMSRRNNTV
jgi:arabinogalactan endo-1,4-beta-galactosidase